MNDREKTFVCQDEDCPFLRGVLGIVPLGGPYWTVPELLFEKKRLIPALQELLVSFSRSAL